VSVESDDLLRHIRQFVHGRVPPAYEDLVTELVGRTVVLIMTTPEFYNHLRMVQELQAENWNLRQALITYQRAEQIRAQRARARKAPGPAKKAAPPKKATPAKSNVRQFKRGATGR
jgi:hypothetical protein